MEETSGRDSVELAVAVAAVALGLFILLGSFSIALGSGYDRIGPRFFPYVVATGLLFSGSILARAAFRRWRVRARAREEARDSTEGVHLSRSRSAILTLSAALASSVVLLEHAGFILASTAMFWLVARAFASKRPRRDALVGLLLSVVVYYAFTRGLGLVLPPGILGRLV
jgi:putative tricarboxylic transport membrane protein